MAKVSVLLPCYHPDLTHLREALQRLLQQSFMDWSLHILHQPWDKDVRAEIADLITDPRITFIQSDVLRNIGQNWNAVLQYADAEYVQFLFHDDLWGPEYLQRSVEALDAHPDAGFSAAAHEYQFEGEVPNKAYYHWVKAESDKTQPGERPGRKFLLQWLKRGLYPNLIGEPPFVMMRREVMLRTGVFSETLPQSLDYEYWVRLLCRANFVWIPESLGAFRVHGMATTALNQREGKGRTDRLRILLQLARNADARVAWAARFAVLRELPKMGWKYARRLLCR